MDTPKEHVRKRLLRKIEEVEEFEAFMEPKLAKHPSGCGHLCFKASCLKQKNVLKELLEKLNDPPKDFGPPEEDEDYGYAYKVKIVGKRMIILGEGRLIT